jgi:hypothetical protein
MKIIFDTERRDTHRVVIVDNGGGETACPCYMIQLSDGKHENKFSRWGDKKKRAAIAEKWRVLVKQDKSNGINHT